jgi:hypothetical protein
MKVIKAVVRTDGSCLNHKKLFVMIPNGHILDARTEKGRQRLEMLQGLGFRFSFNPTSLPYIQILEWEKESLSELKSEEIANEAAETPDSELDASSEEERIKAPSRRRKNQQ